MNYIVLLVSTIELFVFDDAVKTVDKTFTVHEALTSWRGWRSRNKGKYQFGLGKKIRVAEEKSLEHKHISIMWGGMGGGEGGEGVEMWRGWRGWRRWRRRSGGE